MTTSSPFRVATLAISGGLIGSILWLLIAIAADQQRSIPAVLVGVFAGAATRLEPNRRRSTQIVALAVTLIGLTVVQYLIVRHSVVTSLVEAGEDRSVPMFLSPGSMWSVTFGWLRVYPIDTVFWALAVMAAVLIPTGTDPRAEQP